MNSGPLILGSTGQVGRALARTGLRALWQHRPGSAPSAAPALPWDILQAPAPDLPPLSGIVHLARGPDSAAETALARAACDLGERLGLRVLIASSQAVYGPAQGRVTEQTPCRPQGAYGKVKLAMEKAVAGRATCLRIGNVAGCDMLLMQAARGRVSLDRLPDGTSPRRAYIGVQSLAEVIIGLLAHPGPLPPAINVAQPGLVAMADLLSAAAVGFDWCVAGPHVLARLDLDVTCLQSLLPLPLPRAEPAGLIAQARATGWSPAR